MNFWLSSRTCEHAISLGSGNLDSIEGSLGLRSDTDLIFRSVRADESGTGNLTGLTRVENTESSVFELFFQIATPDGFK